MNLFLVCKGDVHISPSGRSIRPQLSLPVRDIFLAIETFGNVLLLSERLDDVHAVVKIHNRLSAIQTRGLSLLSHHANFMERSSIFLYAVFPSLDREIIIKDIEDRREIQVGDYIINYLLYADDKVLTAENAKFRNNCVILQ